MFEKVNLDIKVKLEIIDFKLGFEKIIIVIEVGIVLDVFFDVLGCII